MRRRTKVLTVIAVVFAAGGAFVVHQIATGGEVTEVGVDEAIDRYREQVGPATTVASLAVAPPTVPATAPVATATVPASTAAPTTTEPPVVVSLPAPGVYQYATTGFDRISALAGARHDYPEITTMTVVPLDTCVQLRWDVAVERWNTADWCLANDAIAQIRYLGFHEFFDVPAQNEYVCTGDPRPLDAEPGTTWTTTCTMSDDAGGTTTFTGTAIERTTRTVAGTDIPVLHLRYDVAVAGSSTGTQRIEGWYRTTDGLPVREEMSTTTTQTTVIGDTEFEEEYVIELLTPTPAS